MSFLLSLSRLIDKLNEKIAHGISWALLLAVLICSGNALIRYTFNTSSNAWLEIQWYLFAAVFLLGGGYAFLRNAHVRIDFISSKFSDRTRNWIDVGGIIIFLLPLCYLMIVEGWPLFMNAWTSGEMSSNAGGLIRWPVYLFIPLGFALLMLQGMSELIKRLAFLTGQGPDVLSHTGPSETELLAKEIADAEKHKLEASLASANKH